MSLLVLLAQLLAQSPPAEVPPTTIELELFPLVYGEFQVALHRAGSRYTAFGARAAFRSGPTLWSQHPESAWAVALEGEARVFPLGHAPTQLFVELGLGALLAFERGSSDPASSWSHRNAVSSVSLAMGWCFLFFDHWVVTVRAGVQAQSGAFFSEQGHDSGLMPPIVPLIGIGTGGAL